MVLALTALVVHVPQGFSFNLPCLTHNMEGDFVVFLSTVHVNAPLEKTFEKNENFEFVFNR